VAEKRTRVSNTRAGNAGPSGQVRMERVIIDIFAQLDAPEGSAVLYLKEAEKAHFFSQLLLTS
jgi:hypothetical protein